MGKKLRSGMCLLLSCLLFTGCMTDSRQEKETDAKNSTVTAFIQQADVQASTWKGWGAQRLYEDTGLTLELYSSGTYVEEKLKQYMVSGSIPDIIGFKSLNEAKLYMDAGLLLPLNEYKELLPAIFGDEDYELAITYSEKYLSNKSGELLLMPVSIGETADTDIREIPMLQWKAYEKTGLSPIGTLEDYLDVVEQMLKEKPLSDTGERMYGLSLYQDDEGMSVHTAALAYLYGIDMYMVSPLMEADMKTGKISSVFAEDSFFKRALHFYYEANRRGILDADSRSQTYSGLERKISSGRVMMTWNVEMAEQYNKRQAGYGSGRGQSDGYRAVAAEDLKLYREPNHITGKNQYFAIHRYSANAEEACRLLNWLYEEDTQFFLYNGPQGVIWEYDEEGQPYVTEQGKGLLSGNEQLSGYQGTLEDGIKPFGELGRTPASLTEGGYSLSCRFWDKIPREYPGSGDMTVQANAGVYMVEAVPADLNRTIERIREMTDTVSWEMVYAEDEESFEALWQEMVFQAGELGMRRVEVHYERAWKQALNLAARYVTAGYHTRE